MMALEMILTGVRSYSQDDSSVPRSVLVKFFLFKRRRNIRIFIWKTAYLRQTSLDVTTHLKRTQKPILKNIEEIIVYVCRKYICIYKERNISNRYIYTYSTLT